MILDRSAGELTDAELSTAVTVCASRRHALAASRNAAVAAVVADVLDVLVDERDRRRVLYREMTEATAAAVVRVSAARILHE